MSGVVDFRIPITLTRLHRSIALPALLCVVGTPVFGQPPESTFEDITEVIEVEVPVNVVDRSGDPVRGLTADDFRVIDDGEVREIVDFRVVDLSLIEPGQTRVEIERAVPPAARRHFLLVFDLSFSPPSSLVRARQAARDFVVNELHPTDLAAVAMHTVEGGARVLVTFTPDRAQVARAIDTLGAPRLLQLARRDPLLFLIEDPGLTGFQASQNLPSDGSGAIQSLQDSVIGHLQVIGKEMAKTEKSFSRGRLSSWSRSMADLARLMDSVQGRKHVVYFTEGFDGRLLFGRTPSADDPQFQADQQALQSGQYWLVDTDDMYGNTSLQSDFAVMVEEFRRADCVIQTVDISGLTADTAAEERNRSATRAALFYISNDTGGELFEDANDFGAQLGSLLERSSVTYVLTFEANDVTWDGAYRRLKVKADLPRGARLTHREGYYAPRPYEQLHPMEKSLLASDAIASAGGRSELGLSVLAAPFRASESQAYVPVIVEIDGATLLTGHADDRLPVELYTYASNQLGEMKDFFTQMVTLDLSRGRELFERRGLKYYGHLDLPPGQYLLRVLVRNATTGRSGVTTVPVSVPEYQQARPLLLPPFFVETDRDWFLVRETTGGEYARSVVYPFTVNGEPYIPAARPTLRSREEAKVCLVVYNFGEGELVVDSAVVAGDGTVVDGGVLKVSERTITGIEGLDRLLATFRPDGLEAGEYTLQVALRNVESGAIETNSIPFRLDTRQ